MAADLQKFSKEDCKATEVYARLSKTEHRLFPFCDFNSAVFPVLKFSIHQKEYDYRRCLIAVTPPAYSSEDSAFLEAAPKDPPAEHAPSNLRKALMVHGR